jgi:acetoin utilization deacetylase AcuC-like enzyme
MTARAAVVHSQGYACDIGPHVFPVAKFRLVRDRLVHEGRVAADEILEPAPAPREDLLRVHTPEYLDDLDQLRWTGRTMYSELPLERDIVRAYILCAGGTTLAAREALTRGAAVNLGGGFHHAGPDRAEGFCYINDLAVAVRALQHEGRVRRAAVVDLDVHQGNGTAHVFEGDPMVFTLSMHQENNYPAPKAHSSLDIGLEDGTGDEAYRARLDDALARVWSFAPELVLLQAGADPFRDDQLGGLALTHEGLEARDRAVLEGCARHGIPVVVTLGGGYARQLEDTLRIHLQTCRLVLSGLAASPPAAAGAPGRMTGLAGGRA